MTACFNTACFKGALGRVAVAAVLLLSVGAQAKPTAQVVIDVRAEQAWIREVPPQSEVAAVFVELSNHSKQRVRIVAMSSPLATAVEWHDMSHDHGRMQMQQRLVPELPAGSRVSLAPMASHLMLLGLKQPLQVGMKVPLTLTLSSGQQVSFNAEVRPSL